MFIVEIDLYVTICYSLSDILFKKFSIIGNYHETESISETDCIIVYIVFIKLILSE